MESRNITLPEELTFNNADAVFKDLKKNLDKTNGGVSFNIDCSNLKKIDSAGVIVLQQLKKHAENSDKQLQLSGFSDSVQKTLELFTITKKSAETQKKSTGFFESVGDYFVRFYQILNETVILLSNFLYWGVVALFRPGLRRKGEVVHQGGLIGVNALPIIGLISFLIGFILALQSAIQLRQFGANIYVADLVAIAMVSEMGPLITAIMVAGRSGSAIAAEFAAMTVTEEIDALRVMGIDPIPYIVIPKLYAITLTLPLLTTFANLIGIIGGMVIGVLYLDVDIIPFYNEVIYVLRYKEIFIYLLKSVCFANIIVIVATFFGFRVKGGSEGVGKATTASVVFSIFFVIVADSIIGLFFYFG